MALPVASFTSVVALAAGLAAADADPLAAAGLAEVLAAGLEATTDAGALALTLAAGLDAAAGALLGAAPPPQAPSSMSPLAMIARRDGNAGTPNKKLAPSGFCG